MNNDEYKKEVAASIALGNTQWKEEDNACLAFIDGYKKGLSQFQMIVNKACAFIEQYMESLGYIDDWVRHEEDFRKALENEDVK